MKLIAGLGNPGEKYINTRHNIGFEALKKLIEIYQINLSPKYKSLCGTRLIYDSKIIFAMPQTFMNLSGTAILDISNYFKILPEDIIIIHDDIDINLGNIKIKHNGTSGGHNGIKNIIQCLNTENFNRIRIGVDPKPDLISLDNYVLGKFNPDEKILIDQAINKTCEAIDFILKNNIFLAMNKFNIKQKTKK